MIIIVDQFPTAGFPADLPLPSKEIGAQTMGGRNDGSNTLANPPKMKTESKISTFIAAALAFCNDRGFRQNEENRSNQRLSQKNLEDQPLRRIGIV